MMNKNILNFNLNEKSRFAFVFEQPFEELTLCSDVRVDLLNTKTYHLSNDCLQHNLAILIYFLKHGLDNKLQLHSSIRQDLGYLWNEKLADSSEVELYYATLEGRKYWVGKDYILFDTPDSFKESLTTWMYNDASGEIVIEITPSYRWHFDDPDPNDSSYITYDEFMKDYKPILLLKIPKHIAEAWLKQAQDLLRIVQTNIARTSAKMGIKIDNQNK